MHQKIIVVPLIIADYKQFLEQNKIFERRFIRRQANQVITVISIIAYDYASSMIYFEFFDAPKNSSGTTHYCGLQTILGTK